MSNKFQVLDSLECADNILSGQCLADRLNISRVAVWKHIKALQNEGYNIESTSKGYRLIADCDVIDKEVLQKIAAKDLQFELFDKLDSSNTYLKSIAHKCHEGHVVIAKTQTAGKGRLGRSFYSPDTAGIYMSVLLKPKLNINNTGLITAMSAVAVCEAISIETNIDCSIKWVNDLYYRNKKICGILCEAGYNMELARLDYVVIGIGINVYKSPLPHDIANIATYLLDKHQYNMRNKIIARILERLMYNYKYIESKQFINEYRKRCFIIGKDINVLKPNTSQKARAIDIDDNCRLLVEYENNNKEYLNSGEISIKL